MDKEKHILAVAERLFLQNGYANTKLQDIAKEARVNPALIHYYFRSKEKLYQRIFEQYFPHFIQVIQILNDPELKLVEKVERFILRSWELGTAHPNLIPFILMEVRNPSPFFKKIMPTPFSLHHFYQQVRAAAELGLLSIQDPAEYLLYLLSVVQYPFIAKHFLLQLGFVQREEWDHLLSRYFQKLPGELIAKLKS
jgi:AcrR family transcriptional regulator